MEVANRAENTVRSLLVYVKALNMWRPEDTLQESVFSFHPVGPGDQTQAVSFGGKLLYPLSQSP